MPENDPNHRPNPDAPDDAPPGRADFRSEEEQQLDAANESLADAMRWSFRLLTLIMIFVAAGFALSGFSNIESGERGVVKVFGRITGMVDEGLAYTWPYPVGEIEIVSSRAQEFVIENFWMALSAEQRDMELSEIRAGGGLRLGQDGALFTGDRNLLHVKITCTYTVQDPVAYLQAISEDDSREQTQLQNVIRSLITDSAIRAAGSRTAASIHTTASEAFTRQVRQQAQAQLNLLMIDPAEVRRFAAYLSGLAESRPAEADLAEEVRRRLSEGDLLAAERALRDLNARLHGTPAGEELVRQAVVITRTPVRIESISIKPSWPLGALDSYNLAQRAQSELAARRAQAIAKQKEILLGAAGPNYYKLVGYLQTRPEGVAAPDQGDYDLLGQYAEALDANDPARAGALLARIDEVLLSNETTGRAGEILSEAKAAQAAYMQPVLAWGQRFNELLPSYEANPKLLLTWLWTETEAEILTGKTNEKSMLTPGTGKTVLRINQDPAVVRQIEETQLRGGDEGESSTAERVSGGVQRMGGGQ